ncbi:hypothetical protein LWI28_015177 [Acer negundo]|uniref:Uncharacterized protein n=1 Tax=Acer negundo TaxID=4023 RepID=A0AAD5JEE6_ACENE|nr:hypothetical protein LWI28_015177 [Acer negundo]
MSYKGSTTTAIHLAILLAIFLTRHVVVSTDTTPIPADASAVRSWFSANVRAFETRKATLDPKLVAAKANPQVIMKITIERTKPFVTFYGSPNAMPTITQSGTALQYGTVDNATVIVQSDYFVAANIIFKDSTKNEGQALTLRISGMKAAFYKSKKIKVEDQRGVFWLTVEEEDASVDVHWAEDFLDLADGVSMNDEREPHLFNIEVQTQGVGGEKRGWQVVSHVRTKAKQGRKGVTGVEEEAQAGEREEIDDMQPKAGVPSDNGHQVSKEGLDIEVEEDNLEWNLDKEISKVIEIGCALGYDFSRKKNFIGEELRRWEMEDERRLRELQD